MCILLQACVPYFDILEQWIYKGIISDPYSEVIKEYKNVVFHFSYKSFLSTFFLVQFLVAEHGSVQKEKVTEDYNDAYPLKILSFL